MSCLRYLAVMLRGIARMSKGGWVGCRVYERIYVH